MMGRGQGASLTHHTNHARLAQDEAKAEKHKDAENIECPNNVQGDVWYSGVAHDQFESDFGKKEHKVKETSYGRWLGKRIR